MRLSWLLDRFHGEIRTCTPAHVIALVEKISLERYLWKITSRTLLTLDYEQSPFFLRDSRASETRGHVKIIPREKGETR